jgi:hypothetical protein
VVVGIHKGIYSLWDGLAGIPDGGRRSERRSSIEDHIASQDARQKRCGGYGEDSDGGVVVWVVAADFLAIHNSVDWGS